MENFVIAIPSYQRAESQKTLEYMERLGVPASKVYIFVQTTQDKEEYKRYSKRANIVYAPANGIARARNNILQRLSDTANVLMMDDDISAISRLRGDKLVGVESRAEFAELFNKCFKMAAAKDSPLFGIYPVHNAFFMSHTISTAVTVNTVVGFIKGGGLVFDDSYKAKEDIELCARVLSSGRKVYRYNFMAMNAKHRTNAGGCHDTWHSGENRRTVERLSKAYPDILAPHPTKPDEVKVILKDTDKIDLKRKKE